MSGLQAQLHGEQLKCAELSQSAAAAQHRLVELEAGSGTLEKQQALVVSEAQVQDLQRNLHSTEERLLEAQSVRDLFAKENDACRAELRVARDERLRLEEALRKAQEKQNEPHAHHTSTDPVEAQKAVVQAMQQDFEARVERYREEAKFLRQKCDEKEKKCEQLLAE